MAVSSPAEAEPSIATNNPPLSSSAGGVAAQSPDLGARTSAFLVFGVGFPGSSPSLVPSASQGRPISVVSSFVSTFSLPRSAV